MSLIKLAAAAVLTFSTVVPAMAADAAPTPSRVRRVVVGHPDPNQPSGGSPGYQANTYVRRPSPRTPTDVGNMQFPDASDSPAGRLPAVAVSR